MEPMPSHKQYPPELKERAVAMVSSGAGSTPAPTEGSNPVAQKLGVHTESVRNWVKRHQIDTGVRPGLTTDERKRLLELERQNRGLRRANEIFEIGLGFLRAQFYRPSKK